MVEKEQVTLAEIEKEFEPIIGYKSIKSEMIKICDIMRNSEFLDKVAIGDNICSSSCSDFSRIFLTIHLRLWCFLINIYYKNIEIPFMHKYKNTVNV